MIITERKYGILDMMGIPFRCSPTMTGLIILQMLLSGLVPTLQIIVTAKFIDTAITIVQQKLDIALVYGAIFAVVGLIAYTWVVKEFIKFAQVRLELAIREKYRTAIVEKRSKLAYHHIENHQTWDVISRISQNPENQVKQAFNNLLSMISLALRVVGILVLLVTQVWWAAFVIMGISGPLFALAVKSGKATYQASREVSKIKRRVNYLAEVLTGRETVDERALFGYGGSINDTWYREYESARKIEFKAERNWFVKMKAGGVFTALISILIILVLVGPVLSGAVTVGMFIALVNAVFGLVQHMSWGFVHHVDQLSRHREYIKDLTEFAALEEMDGVNGLPTTPAPVFQSLEFRNVSFTYPGTENPILDGLSFRLEAGKHYAFVGVNGAGKTTITKLMTGLYNQFEGMIYLNGKSIADYSQNELMAFYSVVYQDFAKYSISMHDNIAVGDTHRLAEKDSDERIRSILSEVGLLDVERKLPQGLHTPLGKIKTGGQDISGGEWQRIAMARAILNPAPLRILDEPTAALDPRSESELYEKFEQMSRDKTTVFISHRLGSTKLADEILVIGNGKLLEHGSHHELVSSGGVYAEMYESQRSWYQ